MNEPKDDDRYDPWYGKGYRLLKDGEVIVAGDEFSRFGLRGWVKHTRMIGETFNQNQMQHTRRRVD